MRYELSVSPSLEHLTVTVCSEGPWTDRLVSIHAEARARLVSVRAIGADGSERPLDAGRSGPLAIATRPLSPRDCVRAVLDIASSGGGTNGCMRRGELVTCATSAWMLAAEPWRTGARHRVRLSMAPGHAMSPIFGEDDEGLYVDERSFRYVGYAAFGELERREIEVPGGCASLVVPRGSPLVQSEHLTPWVARAGLASAMLSGRAVARDVTITALPVPGAETPVLFGLAGRGARSSVIALVAERAPASLENDWTLVHELAHLATPYVPAEDAWLAEGLATYYQEVLRARAGMQSAEQAWRQIDDGLRRGARDGTGARLRVESQEMHASGSYGRVYWAGAAIALLWDVALRARGSSLDARLARLEGRHATTMSVAELLDAIDDRDRVLRAIAERWLDAREFPVVSSAYEALGLERSADGELALVGDASLRDAIMNPLREVASNGPCAPIPRPGGSHIE